MLQNFLKWLQRKASGLLRVKFPHKNHFLDILLGIGLYLRDINLACSADHEESPVPDYMEDSFMELKDTGVILGVLKSLSKAMDYTTG